MVRFQHLFLRYVIVAVLAAAATFEAGIAAGGEQSPGVPDLQDLTIEELMAIEVQTVYSASRYEQKVTEAPSSVTIVTSADIRNFGYRTLSDILQATRGFSITYDRNYHRLGMRGFGRPGDNNTRALLLIDGHRLNDNIYDSAPIGNDFILDVDLIERIEISRGPGSSLYGSNAFFGVINIVTRRGAEVNGGELSGAAGSFGEVRGRASTGIGSRNDSDALLSATSYRRSGDDLYFEEYDSRNPFFDPRAGNSGIAEERDYERYRTIFFKSSLSGFTLQAAYSKRTKGIPTAPAGSDFNKDSKTSDQRAYVDLSTVHRVNEHAELSLRISGDLTEHTDNVLYSGIVNKDHSRGQWAGAELQAVSRIFDQHRVILGAEYIGNLRQDQENADQEPFIAYLTDNRRSRRWAAYIQDEFAPGPVFRFIGGVRYDNTSLANGSVHPRLAAIYAPSADSAFKLLYGSAFRSPSVYELYYESSSSVPPSLANPGLNPEKIRTYEMVYEQYLPGGIRTSVDGFYYRIDDLINQTRNESGNLVYVNLDAAEASGVELEIEKKSARGMSGRASYSLQRATDLRTGDVLTNSPRDQVKLNLAAPLTKLLLVGLEEQYTGRRKTGAGTYAGSFAVTNITLLRRNVLDAFELSLSCYNLFNKRYSDPVNADLSPLDTVDQDGRTVRIKATYAF